MTTVKIQIFMVCPAFKTRSDINSQQRERLLSIIKIAEDKVRNKMPGWRISC
ncbi:hypothetical protein [uncultured Chryseobacterium sp.]|uniref:hypothetical protein n=1 Tax=uncultured Chryseobacterium sp. TaxID=259322 RepID=UPI0025E27AE3|nr:hypothetical protein [uncultured Chryseobacterium sp.]